jgi:hypothetical protein
MSGLETWRHKLKVFGICLSIFLATTFVDYVHQKDIFNFGKLRIVLLLSAIPLYLAAKKHVGVFIALFLGFMLCSWVQHGYQLYGTFDIIMAPATVFLAAYLTRLPSKSFAAALTWAGVFESVFALLQTRGIYPLFRVLEPWGQFKPIGTIGQETWLGAFLIAALPAALWTKRYWQAALIFICCLTTKSSMTYGSAGIVIFFFLSARYKWWKVAGVSAMAVALLLFAAYLKDKYFFLSLIDPNGRLYIWSKAVEAWRQNLIIGGGPGWFGGFYQPTNNLLLNGVRVKQVHCEPLELLVEYGLVGGSLLVGAIGSFIAKFRLSWHHITCVAILFNSVGNFPIHQVGTALIFMAAWIYSYRGEANE